MDFLKKLNQLRDAAVLSEEMENILRRFFFSYAEAIEQNNGQINAYQPLLLQLLDMIVEQIQSPFLFAPYHKKIKEPFDYYQFGLDFIRPIVKLDASSLFGLHNVDSIVSHLSKGGNVILFGNHQTEPDPQAICLLLERTHPQLADDLIFVAGHRVVTDPCTVPFSKGCHLLCIYSQKYIEHPHEEKHEKLSHNRHTMKKMRELLDEGGKCIYVAPSGGRDRPGVSGEIEVAPFNPQSVEMFRLMAELASHPTHFYPLALATFDLLPPPNSVNIELGENRHTMCTPIHLAFGSEIAIDKLMGDESLNKKEKRKMIAEHIWNQVRQLYSTIIERTREL
ncbi:MAG: 1-acyl-sn-glycerol-3-phosphate acyltransferase [Waddliaceae bacterium]